MRVTIARTRPLELRDVGLCDPPLRRVVQNIADRY
jgi:hypothetical protein